jgi:hypothetical protein
MTAELTLHLLLDELNETLAPGENPPVHDVLALGRVRIVLEVHVGLLLEKGGLSEEEAVRVEEGEENMRNDILDSLLLEAERVTANDGRVDEEETEGVGSVRVDDEVGVRVVLERLGHLLAIAVVVRGQAISSSILLGEGTFDRTHAART